MILSAKIANYLAKQSPDGFAKEDMEPRNEYQMRPLALLQSKEQWVEAWCQAVTKASGQPTHVTVESVVNEMIGSSGPKRVKQPSLKEIVQEVIARIRILMDEGRPNEEIERLLVELHEAVNTKKKVDSQ